jgi:hypothetical protein
VVAMGLLVEFLLRVSLAALAAAVVVSFPA